jgi:hypothetical protein
MDGNPACMTRRMFPENAVGLADVDLSRKGLGRNDRSEKVVGVGIPRR